MARDGHHRHDGLRDGGEVGDRRGGRDGQRIDPTRLLDAERTQNVAKLPQRSLTEGTTIKVARGIFFFVPCPSSVKPPGRDPDGQGGYISTVAGVPAMAVSFAENPTPASTTPRSACSQMS